MLFSRWRDLEFCESLAGTLEKGDVRGLIMERVELQRSFYRDV
jgi:hypothetical protein